jgi:hypothetical protein
MRRIVANFVPRLLQNEQEQHCLEICRELQQQLQEEKLISKVVTGSIRLLSLHQDENQVERVKI